MKPVTNRGIVELNPSSTEEEAKELYDSWAENYEVDLVENHGYKAPQLCVEAFNKAIQSEEIFPGADKNMKILDAGAGTGMIGEMLVKQGYTNIDALDISQNMLNEAKKKNVYKRLICAPLSDVRIEQIQTAEYDVTLCGGTIVYGQAKPVALDECIRHVRPGGLFIFTLRADSFDPKYGYCTKFDELEKAGKWRLVNRELRELYTDPHEERFRDCYLITYKVIQN
ncbi:hypothetical protein pdam_00024052 [Pocillopora damicornis]|uniref:Methyltransferase type 11 domain-containing protein n=1 Tax=Pocillopora damicornis TaxID=46731 RepID=A0A3M6TCU1_POCDA|nr:uncharacterized protein LOC113679388 [Pocillopora damicornis]RMX39212.1 hypothetical protein pdam_00024052 [Pocillopora damicornis]